MNFEEQTDFLAGLVFNTMVDNENWKIFGFKSRPSRGRVFERFVNKSKLAAESFVIKELALISIIDVIEATKRKSINDFTKIALVVSFTAKVYKQLYSVEIFRTSQHFLRFMQQGVDDYLKSSTAMITRSKEVVEAQDILDGWDTNLVRGAIEFCRTISSKSGSEGLVIDRAKIASEGIMVKDLSEKLLSPLSSDVLNDFIKFASYSLGIEITDD